MSTKWAVVLAALALVFGFVVGSLRSNPLGRKAGKPEIIASQVISRSWSKDEPNPPSGAVTFVPDGSRLVYLPKITAQKEPEDTGREAVAPWPSVRSDWVKFAHLDDITGERVLGVVVLPRKQNNPALAYIIYESGRAHPVNRLEMPDR